MENPNIYASGNIIRTHINIIRTFELPRGSNVAFRGANVMMVDIRITKNIASSRLAHCSL